MQIDGPDALKSRRDPFGDGPFEMKLARPDGDVDAVLAVTVDLQHDVETTLSIV